MKARYPLLGLAILAIVALAPPALSSPQARFADPRYAVPVAVAPGQSFNATLLGVQTVSAAWIVAPGFNVTLRLVGSWRLENGLTVTLEVPQGTAEALYDLCASTGEAVVCELRSVWVLGREPEKLAIAHLTDTHVEIVVGGVSSTLYVETAIHLVNALPVDLAVVTGDCVDVGSHIDSLKKLQELVNRARKPTFLLPGNHDHAQTDERSFGEVYYGRFVGPATWYRVIGPFLIAALDTGYLGVVDPSQLAWLEGVLAAHRGKVKILAMHHPLFRAALFRGISGSWREIESIRDYIYSSWAARLDIARELLRLIEEYNVTLVLAGHVHTDGLVIYNGRTWFVTTAPTGGQGAYRGIKIVEIDREGRVRIIGAAGKDPLREPSSLVIDGTLVRVVYALDLRAASVVGRVSPDLGFDLRQLTIYLRLNSSQPIDAYRAYGDAALVKGVEIVPYGGAYLAKLVLVVPAEEFKVVVASFRDEVPPSVTLSLHTPVRPVAGRDSVTLYIRATDEGWGVWRVYVDYAWDNGSGSLLAQEISPATFQAALPPLNVTSVRLTIRAVDFAGNVGTATAEIQYVRPVVERLSEQQPAQQPAQPAQPEQSAPEQPSTPVPTLMVAAAAAIVAVAAALVITRRRRY